MDYFMSKETLTVFAGGRSYNISSDHPRFKVIRDKLANGEYETDDDVIADIDQEKLVEANLETDRLSVKNGVVTYRSDEHGDIVLNNTLTKRLVHMLKRSKPVLFLARFIENLMQNPSETAIFELYGFLEENNLPITEDGCFLAYKKVLGTYLDTYTETISNKVGEIVEMDRDQVNPDRDQTCSTGLHFASYSYMEVYGRGIGEGYRIMVVKINPKDVVSIPSDYNNAKGRCSRYEVVAELPTNQHRIRPYYASDEYGRIVDEDWDEDDPDYFDEEYEEDWEEEDLTV